MSDLLLQIPLVFALLFAFDDFVGRILHSIGYDNLVFLNVQYREISNKITEIKLIDFQILEIAIWLSIGICAARFLLGVIFLRQYDKYFLTVSKTHRGKVYGVFILGVVSLWAAASMNQHLTIASTVLLMKYFPRAYFIFMSTLWFWGIWMISISSLFVIWKVFRQSCPWTVLWSDDRQHEAHQS